MSKGVNAVANAAELVNKTSPFTNPEVAPFWARSSLDSVALPFLETVLPAVLFMRYPPQGAEILSVGSGGESGRVILLARPLDARLPSCFAFAQTDAVAALCGPLGHAHILTKHAHATARGTSDALTGRALFASGGHLEAQLPSMDST